MLGCGDPSHIEKFQKVTGYTGRIVTDPSREAFAIMGLTSSIGGLLGKKTFSRGFSALRKGIKPGSLQGSALQLGGAIVVGADGDIRYLYRSSEVADDPPIGEMLAALN